MKPKTSKPKKVTVPCEGGCGVTVSAKEDYLAKWTCPKCYEEKR